MTAVLLATLLLAEWIPQQSGSKASLRGVHASSARVVWASGTKGTVLKSIDGGEHWKQLPIPNTESLDFRDIETSDAQHAWAMSSGTGDKARVYRTVDGGANWTLDLTNPDATGFFDAIAFFSKTRGVLLGDPIDGRLTIFTTDDGVHWKRQTGPEARENEGAFAASGTCLIARPNGEAWIGTGAARVFHSTDFGATWTPSQTPLNHEGKAAGVFSVAFRDSKHGIAVGGDYTKPTVSTGNIATTEDGGRTWHEPKSIPTGFRSAVEFRSTKQAITTGTSGSDVSNDAGATWQLAGTTGYNAISFHGKEGWAVGPEGRIARWR